MSRIIIETPFPLEVQENDHWSLPIGIDNLAIIGIPANSVFHFAVFDKKRNLILNRPNLTTSLISGENFITVTGLPADTLGHGGKDMFWELQAKTPAPDNKYYTIATGPFDIRKTYIANA